MRILFVSFSECSLVRARINEELAKSSFDFFIFISLKIHEKFNFGSYQETAQCVLGNKKVQKTQKGQRTPVGNDRGERWLAFSPSAAASGRFF